MNKRIIPILMLSLVLNASCGKRNSQIITVSGQEDALPDCTGYKADLVVPYGFTGTVSSTMGGKKFAKIIAVDSVDGTMKIMITPPDNSSSFSTAFINEFSDYKLRFIACREDLSSVSSGSSTTGVCSRSGSINIVGKDNIIATDFTTAAFVVNGTNIHATRDPQYDIANNYILKPDFIMLTASIFDDDPLGQFMIAFGRSPYYTGCYSR